jgi:hypothetical protein
MIVDGDAQGVVQPRARGSFIPHSERSHRASLIRPDAIDLFGENEVTARHATLSPKERLPCGMSATGRDNAVESSHKGNGRYAGSVSPRSIGMCCNKGANGSAANGETGHV